MPICRGSGSEHDLGEEKQNKISVGLTPLFKFKIVVSVTYLLKHAVIAGDQVFYYVQLFTLFLFDEQLPLSAHFTIRTLVRRIGRLTACLLKIFRSFTRAAIYLIVAELR